MLIHHARAEPEMPKEIAINGTKDDNMRSYGGTRPLFPAKLSFLFFVA